ncbi:MAG: hypothetical protein JO301_00780 [Chitinophagaceae bacterium]|nr:hypothetical protein [Chitinophagaceae bacterium]
MAINKNHEFEELNGVKCAIVEKNVSKERADFLETMLRFNKYEVIVVPVVAAPKPAPAAAVPGAEPAPEPAPVMPEPPALFTVGVTDVTFNPTNAIFGRLLKTQGGRVITLAYWRQQEPVSHDEIPYFEKSF